MHFVLVVKKTNCDFADRAEIFIPGLTRAAPGVYGIAAYLFVDGRLKSGQGD
jgi:hypothetical protein